METDLGVLTIAKTTDRELTLEKLNDTGRPGFRTVIDAVFDRISGHLDLWDYGVGRHYDLTCKKTTPVL